MRFFCCWDKRAIKTCNTDKLTVVLMTSSSKLYYPVFLTNSSVPLLLTSVVAGELYFSSASTVSQMGSHHCNTDGLSSL